MSVPEKPVGAEYLNSSSEVLAVLFVSTEINPPLVLAPVVVPFVSRKPLSI